MDACSMLVRVERRMKLVSKKGERDGKKGFATNGVLIEGNQHVSLNVYLYHRFGPVGPDTYTE